MCIIVRREWYKLLFLLCWKILWVAINQQNLMHMCLFFDNITQHTCRLFKIFRFFFFLIIKNLRCLIIQRVSSKYSETFSREQSEIIYFFIFFPENRLWDFMQIVSAGDSLQISCKLSLLETIYMYNKRHIFSLGKIRRKKIVVSQMNFAWFRLQCCYLCNNIPGSIPRQNNTN